MTKVDYSEIETVMSLSKFDRLNDGVFRIWTNDTVMINKLNRFGVQAVKEFNYVLQLTEFTFLPKRRSNVQLKEQFYPEWLVMQNDLNNKETLVTFTLAERKKDVLNIFTEDEYYLSRCKKYKLPYKDQEFISQGIFIPFSKRKKLTAEHIDKLHGVKK